MKFIIAVKSGNISSLNTAYNFLTAVLTNKDPIEIQMIFFYQNGSYILLNSAINQKWIDLLVSNKLLGLICPSSCKKRGLNIENLQPPFKSSSIIEFINHCETAERIIQF